MPTTKLTSTFVAKATSAGKPREYYWDQSIAGFGLMVTERGAKSFCIQWRAADGRTRRMSINGGRKFAAAKQEAKKLLGKIAHGENPLDDKRAQRDARANTLRRIVEDQYLVDHDVQKLRSVATKRWIFERYIFPHIGARPVEEIKRSEIVRMLDNIKRGKGTGAASNSYKILRRFFVWYAPYASDDYVSPIIQGTFNASQGDGARTLTDDEIRILWNVASEGRNPHDFFVKLTLLTAARRSETADMTRGELSADGLEWCIPSSRYKGQDGKSAHAHLIPLSQLAREVLAGIPVINGSKWIFTTTGRAPISGYSKFKLAFDKRLHAALDQEGDEVRRRIIADLHDRYPGRGFEPFDSKWQTHSLRKTARTLLSRVKIDQQTAERCLGHVTGGIVGTYNHHEFKLEKRTAFESLAREIARIVLGESLASKVIPLSRA
jgi:integrase